MNIGELILSFKLKLDKIDSQAFPDILTDEIRYWLDQGANRFVKQRYTGNNYRRKSFEQERKRLDDLRDTVVTTSVSSSAPLAVYPGLEVFALPNDYRYLVKVSGTVEYNDCNNAPVVETKVFLKHVDHDDYLAILNDPFNMPEDNDPVYFTEGNNIIIDAGVGKTVTNIAITYIKLLQHIQNNVTNANGTSDIYTATATDYTELAIDSHEEFVDIAVKMVLENIESQRYQSNSVEITQQE